MKRSLFISFMALLSLSGFAQYGTQFENRGLEDWANFGSSPNTIEPLQWHSSMSADGPFAGFLSQQIEPSNITRPGSSGSKSARIWAKSVMGIIANGNLTKGRMHAGSMSPGGSNNYNYTQRSDDRFNMPITKVPDSLTLWVCFRAGNLYQEAQARAIVHGDADMAALSYGAVNPENMLVATAMLNFTRTAEPGVNYQWRRLSIPFVTNGPCTDPRYLLFSVYTNKIPGEGDTSDEMLIDDILLIYKPVVELLPLNQTNISLGETLDIDFFLEGTMSPENLGGLPNEVILQLSSPTGSFSNPTELGRMASNTSGTFHVTIPGTIAPGDHYRMRIATTNYPMISEDNGTDLTIGPATTVAEAMGEGELLGIEVFDLTGRLVMTMNPRTSEENRLSEKLSPGNYLVRYHKTDAFEVKKILIH